MTRLHTSAARGTHKSTLAFVVAVLGAALVFTAGSATSAPPPPAAPPATPLLPDPVRYHDQGDWFRHVCAGGGAKAAGCGAQVVSNAGGTPLASTTPPTSAYGPVQFHTAYNLPTGPSTQTIGIVDAFGDPNIQSDLAAYDTQYGLTCNNCLTVVNQSGAASPLPSGNSWHLEIALDVETAHEICQSCHILLVEATDNSFANLGTAVDEAVALGANVVSNSYGGGEYSGETGTAPKVGDDFDYDHPGVAITASTGDGGYGVEYPAASRYVTAVGGTTLKLNANGSYQSESVWSGAGSGCSAFEPKPAWQTDTGCPRRTVGDVSADADPNTGAAVYDSVGTTKGAAWYQVGGTSLASPLVAAVYALAGNSSVNAGSTPYAHASSLRDVTSGSNGNCGGSYLCTGKTGYDGPSGLGTPNGVGAFQSGPPTPDFSLAASPSSSTIAQGGSTGYTVTDSPVNGFTDQVSLSVAGLPTGATPTFTPAAVGPGTSLSSTLSITTTATIAPGTYPLTISGSNGTITRTMGATLVISPPPPSLTASPSTIGGGGAVTATWANVASPTTSDWIGVFTHTASNTSYLSFVYDSSCTTTRGTTAKASGACQVTMPTTAGSYELRLFSNGGSAPVATSGLITVTAPKSTPTLTTSASAGVTIGGLVSDTATLTGGSSPSGTVTFNLYGPGNSTCTGTPIFSSTNAVGSAHATSDQYQPASAGTYLWVASYSGDASNNGVTAACGASGESVTLSLPKVTPTLSTVASAGVTAGAGAVTDTATLSGGSSPSGTVTFSLYGPGNSTCTGSPVFASTIAVSSGHATSGAFKPASAGTYLWVASYSGDSANNAVAGHCGDTGESVAVTAPAGPSLTVNVTSVARGGKVTVSWSGVTSPSTTDWIGVYMPGAANTSYLSWIYDSSCTTAAGHTALSSGSCSFTMPSTAGTYQLRLLSNNGYTLLATSPSITTT